MWLLNILITNPSILLFSKRSILNLTFNFLIVSNLLVLFQIFLVFTNLLKVCRIFHNTCRLLDINFLFNFAMGDRDVLFDFLFNLLQLLSIHGDLICPFFGQLLNLGDVWFINFWIVKLIDPLVQTFKVLKLHVNVLLHSDRLLIINPGVFVVVFEWVFSFLFFLWWGLFLLDVPLLHYLLVESVSKHVVLVYRCLISKVLLELKNRKINVFFLLFKITKIIDFVHIGVRNSKDVKDIHTLRKMPVQKFRLTFWLWRQFMQLRIDVTWRNFGR